MRGLIGAMLGLGLLAAGPGMAFELPIGVDKVAHAGLSYAMTDMLMRGGIGAEQAVVMVLFVGWLKEVADPQADPWDLAADAAGALAAAAPWPRVPSGSLSWRF